jgi:hypothetical protein
MNNGSFIWFMLKFKRKNFGKAIYDFYFAYITKKNVAVTK